jgi:hypothetical protein
LANANFEEKNSRGGKLSLAHQGDELVVIDHSVSVNVGLGNHLLPELPVFLAQ